MYQPDCDYLNGEAPERNMAVIDHGSTPEGRGSRVRARIKDFLKMGVPSIWVLDPQEKAAFLETPGEGLREVKDGILRTLNATFEVSLGELFS